MFAYVFCTAVIAAKVAFFLSNTLVLPLTGGATTTANVAVTLVFAFIITEQVPVPLHAPLQPEKV